MTTVGFLGLGAMGAPMAQQVLDAGHRLKVWNRTRARTEPFAKQGAEVLQTPAEVAGSCDIVLSCLLNTEVIREVYLGERGVFAGAREGLVLVEHGTFQPDLAAELGEAASQAGVLFVDAPVSGGAAAAQAGSLVVMAGGPTAAERPVREVAGCYASVVEWLGPVGSGLQMKLVNQMLVTSHVAASAEAARLINYLGLSPEGASRVLGGGWAQSAMLDRCLPMAFEADLTADSNAPIGGLAEAQRLISELAEEAGTQLPVFTGAAERFAEAVRAGWGSRDFAALVGLYDPAADQ